MFAILKSEANSHTIKVYKLREEVTYMNPKQFLLVGGVVLLLLGVLGLVLPGGQLLGTDWYLTMGENVAHLVLGVVAVAASFVLDAKMQKMLTTVVGVVALFFGVYGFMVAGVPALNTFGLANLETPYDNVLHLAVGAWAFYAAYASDKVTGAK
jgi:hypothetical protein